MENNEKVEIRCSVDKATRETLLAMSEKHSRPGHFADFVGELLAKAVTKK